MTKQELLNLEHLSIAEETVFVHVHTEEGFIITDYKEGDEITNYSGSECMYMPIKDEYVDYRIITVEEHKEFERLREEELRNKELNKNE